MKDKDKARKKKINSRFKKVLEQFPSFPKFKKALDEAYKLAKKIPSSGSENLDDTDSKELANARDVMQKTDEINKKEKKKEEKIEEPFISKELKEGLLDLHDLIVDGTESVANVKYAAVKKDIKRGDEEMQYRNNLDKLFTDANAKAKVEFDAINSGWEGLKALQNPLEIHRGTNFLREKCEKLLQSKDDMINYLKNEIKNKDDRFVIELEKQGGEIDILIDRIEEQISVLKDAYLVQLEKLENMIDNEKDEIIVNNRNIWEKMINERDDIDKVAIDTMYKLVEDHEKKLDMDNIEQNEKQRALEIELNNIIHKMTVELDRMRSMCTLNIEKISYNYQLLLKRQTENQVIKSQNKRRIIKLKDEIEYLKKQIQTGSLTLQKEISAHVSAIDNLQIGIKELEERSAALASANSKKYFDLWDFNQKRAEDILHQIFDGDKALFEQVLYMPWTAPETISFPKDMMPCYKEGLKMCELAKKEKLVKPRIVASENEHEETHYLGLIKLVITNLPSACSFFLDKHLRKQTETLPPEEKLLLELDGIFNALCVHKKEDMHLLAKYFAKYIICPDCSNSYITYKNDTMVKKETRQYMENLQPKENSTVIDSEKRIDDNEIASENEDHIENNDNDANLLADRIKYNLKIIADTVYNEIQRTQESKKGCEILEVPDKVKLKPGEIAHSEIRKEDIIEKHSLFGMRSDDYQLDWFISTLKPSCFEAPKKEDKREAREDSEAEEVRFCTDPTHKPYISPIDIAKAIKDFALDFFSNNKMKKNKSLCQIMTNKKITLSRCMEEKDVENFWNQFLLIFPKQKIDLWDTMYTALQDYHKVLQKRHDLNTEIRKLKKSNFELRRLLQRYIESSKSKVEYVEYFKDLQHELSFENESSSNST